MGNCLVTGPLGPWPCMVGSALGAELLPWLPCPGVRGSLSEMIGGFQLWDEGQSQWPCSDVWHSCLAARQWPSSAASPAVCGLVPLLDCFLLL